MIINGRFSNFYPDRLTWGDQLFVRLFVGGAVGGALFALLDVVTHGMDAAFIAVYALLGAAILPVAELASRPALSWWAQGLLFGATGGVLLALSSHALFPDDPLLLDLIANGVGGIFGGLIWKCGDPFEEARQNNSATREPSSS